MNIIILAPPLAGKGTISKMLVDKCNLTHISTGNIIRNSIEEIKQINPLVEEELKQGMLVSDEIVNKLLSNFINKHQNRGFIFDGYPRNKEQIHSLDLILKENNLKIDYVFYLNMGLEVLKRRLENRRVCEDCQATYNISNPEFAPKVENICDQCGGKLIVRDDDNFESFKVRYDTYNDVTQPVVDYYKDLGILIELDFENSKESLNAIIEMVTKDLNND